MSPKYSILIVASLVAAVGASAAAQTPVKAGKVLRGTTTPGVAGAPDTPTARTCNNFSREDVDQAGRMTGASVQCGAGKTVAQLKQNLPVGSIRTASPTSAGSGLRD